MFTTSRFIISNLESETAIEVDLYLLLRVLAYIRVSDIYRVYPYLFLQPSLTPRPRQLCESHASPR